MEHTPTSWMGRVRTMPCALLAGAISQVKRRFKQLKSRYGPHYTKAMVGAAFVALFSPIPGSVFVAVALIVAIAEVHRAISKRDGPCKTRATELDRSMKCDVVLQWNAPPAELTNLGALNGVELRDRKATG